MKLEDGETAAPRTRKPRARKPKRSKAASAAAAVDGESAEQPAEGDAETPAPATRERKPRAPRRRGPPTGEPSKTLGKLQYSPPLFPSLVMSILTHLVLHYVQSSSETFRSQSRMNLSPLLSKDAKSRLLPSSLASSDKPQVEAKVSLSSISNPRRINRRRSTSTRVKNLREGLSV